MATNAKTPKAAASRTRYRPALPDLSTGFSPVDLCCVHDAAMLAEEAVIGVLNQPRTSEAAEALIDDLSEFLALMKDRVLDELLLHRAHGNLTSDVDSPAYELIVNHLMKVENFEVARRVLTKLARNRHLSVAAG